MTSHFTNLGLVCATLVYRGGVRGVIVCSPQARSYSADRVHSSAIETPVRPYINESEDHFLVS